MEWIISWKSAKGLLIFYFVVLGEAYSFTYPEEQVDDQTYNWPTAMAFHETKTNSMLGEALLKRLYSRIEHTENLFRVELGQIYDKLKQDIHKNFRKCDRKRRKADSPNNNNKGSNNNEEKSHQKRDRKRGRKKENKNKSETRDSGVRRPYEPWPSREDHHYESKY